jgi:hypothetical protein
MRPREETSAEPIVCADVNEGLIEVSPSLVKPVAAVKPPSGILGRFLSGISFERLLDHPRRRVDADDVEPIRARVLELVGSLWAHDRDVARTRLDVLTARGDPRLSAADNPGLGIGMLVQVRPLTGSLSTRGRTRLPTRRARLRRSGCLQGCAAVRPLE